MRTILLTLRTCNGKPVLDYGLGLSIASETVTEIQVKISDQTFTLKKSDWINRNKVWDNGTIFFIVANKYQSKDYSFDILMKHSINKIESRINKLQDLKKEYKKLLTAA